MMLFRKLRLNGNFFLYLSLSLLLGQVQANNWASERGISETDLIRSPVLSYERSCKEFQAGDLLRTFSYSMSFSPKGQLLNEYLQEGSDIERISYSYRYDEGIISKTSSLNDALNYTLEQHFTAGQLAKEILTNAKGVTSTTYHYDQKGNLERLTSLHNGKLSYEELYSYEEGRLITVLATDFELVQFSERFLSEKKLDFAYLKSTSTRLRNNQIINALYFNDTSELFRRDYSMAASNHHEYYLYAFTYLSNGNLEKAYRLSHYGGVQLAEKPLAMNFAEAKAYSSSSSIKTVEVCEFSYE